MIPVLSARQVRPLLVARTAGSPSATTSLDLNLSTVELPLMPEGVRLPDGQVLAWEDVEEIADDPEACWEIERHHGRLRPCRIYAFSEALQRPCSLLAMDRAPSITIGGFVMHRIKGSDPWRDTEAKIKAAAPVRGRVLDTTTGLGYTAIQAARTATEVVTIELDPTVLDLARLNPWSQPLFHTTHIRQIVGDSYDEVESFPACSFDLVIHDPPSFSLAGELYSGEFYRRLFRVLLPGGRLFHYIGNPESKHGATVTRGVVRRLKEAGFERVTEAREAFGVVASRGRRV